MEQFNKREQILKAAVTAFLERGFEGTSMDFIAKQADVARRTLYNQFESKEELFETVLDYIWQDIKPYELKLEDKDPQEILFHIGTAIANYWSSEIIRDYLRLVVMEGTRFKNLPKLFYSKGKSPMIASVHHFLNRMIEENVMEIDNIELAAKQFFGMINEPLLWMRLIDGTSEITDEQQKEVVTSAVYIFFKAHKKANIIFKT